MLGDSQIVTIPFGGGVNERDREEALLPGEMRVVSCMQITKTSGYAKAPGNVAQSMSIIGGGTVTGPKHQFAFRRETLLATSTNLYSRSPMANAWRSVGLIPACTAKRVGVGAFTSAIYSAGSAACNGYLLVSWTTATTLFWTVLDSATLGIVASGSTVIGAISFVSVAFLGTQIVTFYAVDGTTEIRTLQFDTPSLTMFGPVVTAGNAYAGFPSLDTVSMSDRIALVFNNNSGGVNSISCRTFNVGTGVLGTLQTNNAIPSVNPPFGAVGICGDPADQIYIGSSEAANVTAVRSLLTSTLAVNGTKATVFASSSDKIGMFRNTATTGFVWSSKVSTNRVNYATFTLTAGAIVAGPGPIRSTNAVVYSKPFQIGSRFYGMVYPEETGLAPLNQTRNCVDLTEFQTVPQTSNPLLYPMATIAPQLTAFFDLGAIQSPAVISATKLAFVGGSLRTAGSGSIEIDVLDFANVDVAQAARYGDLLGIAGGTPYTYDGASTCEMGFAVQPGVLTSVVGAGALPAGNYGWAVVYERVDAAGQFHRSAPSPVLNVVMGGANGNVISVPRMPYSANTSPTMARLYRTELNGPTFYPVPVPTVDVSPNGPTTPYVDFAVDNTTDASLITGNGIPLMYTQPGQIGTAVPRLAPPSLTSLIAHQDRLVGIGDDGSTMWVSGQLIQGDGLWWSSFAGFQYPQLRGSIAALCSFDGHIIGFTKTEPLVIDGQGPTDSGQGGGFVTYNIVSDVGCKSQRSVCVTAGGVLFQSSRGIERLNRSLQVDNYFGSRVEDTLGLFPIITSATNSALTGRVLFSCVATEGNAAGTFLEWDYANGVWTVCPRLAGLGCQSATMPDSGIFTWVSTTGIAYSEDSTTSLDGGVYKPGAVVTPWVHVQGVTGWQNVDTLALLAKSLSGHDLRIRIAYDYSSTFTDDQTWTAAQIAALTTPRELLQMDLTRPECTAFQVRIDDIAPTSGSLGTGFGPTLIGLQLRARGDDELARLPEANRK